MNPAYRGDPCKFPKCPRTAWSGGLCNGHLEQRRKGKPLTPINGRVRWTPDMIERATRMLATKSEKAVAMALGVKLGAVRWMVRAGHLGVEDTRQDPAHAKLPRCKCGLLLDGSHSACDLPGRSGDRRAWF